MNLKSINNEAVESRAVLGLSYNFHDICLIYPLTIEEVVSLENKYSSYLGLLTISKTNILTNLKEKKIDTTDFENISVLEYLIMSCYYNKEIEKSLRAALQLFTRESVTLIYSPFSIIFGDIKNENRRVLTAEDFLLFQNVIRIQNGLTIEEIPIENESPMKKKFREKAALRDYYKNLQNSQQESTSNLADMIVFLCIYTNYVPQEVKELSFLAFNKILEYTQKKENWEMYLQMKAAGAEIKEPTKYWKETKK